MKTGGAAGAVAAATGPDGLRVSNRSAGLGRPLRPVQMIGVNAGRAQARQAFVAAVDS
jgi:hypothetical protein